MKQYTTILFDLDGTLMNTAPGILNCYKHALTSLGKPEPENGQLGGVIGAPLLEVFKSYFDMDEKAAINAVKLYRKRYAEQGIKEAYLYSGVEQLLKILKERGYKLGVATLKAECFAKTMLKNVGVAGYFNIIRGIDEKDTDSKAEILNQCLEFLGSSPGEVLLVGDSSYDAEGAAFTNIDFAAVLYGYGFKSVKDAARFFPVLIAETTEEIDLYLSL